MILELSRTWARIVGLLVVATVAVAATQMLALGFETTPLIDADAVASVVDWIERPPLAGVGMIVAVALIVAGLIALFGTLLPRRGGSAITIRRRDGWTRIERRSLEAAIQRQLQALDRRSNVDTSVRRSGKVDVDLTSIDVMADGPAGKLRDALGELCEERHLPCTPGTISVRARRSTKKRRHTIE